MLFPGLARKSALQYPPFIRSAARIILVEAAPGLPFLPISLPFLLTNPILSILAMRLLRPLSLLVSVSACALLFTSCTKKPNIDLSGVVRNPAALGQGAGNREGMEGFVPAPTDFSQLGDGGNGIAIGPWEGTDKPAAGAGSDFLKNTQRWEGVVYFEYDQSEIVASEREKLDSLATFLNENPALGVIIEGHTDERGSDEYNRALGERRALSVQQYLTLLGVEDARMQTVSFGEDKPVVMGAASESEHARNRRAEFVLGER